MTATLGVQDPQALFDEPEYRVEGPLKVTGAARYTADVLMPGMLWLAYTRSPRPHARIVAIDTSAARQVPGVHAVLTGADIGEVRLGRCLLDWPALAMDRVRMVGDRVAAIAAETRQAADEASQLVEVEYEDLPAVTDARAALGAELLLVGQTEEGIAILRQFIAADPSRVNRIPAHVLLAMLELSAEMDDAPGAAIGR